MKKPLPPDTRHEPFYQGELTLEVTYSRTNAYRSVISRDSNGRFRVRREKWDVRDRDFTNRRHWISERRGMTIAVSLETARALAEEKLKETTDGLNSSTP